MKKPIPHQNSGPSASTSGAAGASSIRHQPQPDLAARNVPVLESKEQKIKEEGTAKKKKKGEEEGITKLSSQKQKE